MREFLTMCTRPLVRDALEAFVEQIETVCKKISCGHPINKEGVRKWSGVVAGRNLYTPVNGSAAPHNIEMVITSRPSQPYKGNHAMETSGIIHSLSTRKGIKKYKYKRPGIIVIGDSLARGYAGELLHHVKQHYNVVGYTKPNPGLSELLNTAKEVSSKLTKKDTVIVLGGGLMIWKETCMGKT